jgi:transmembrane sensor
MQPRNFSEAERIIYLVSHFAIGDLSNEEVRELNEWKSAGTENSDLFDELMDGTKRAAALERMKGFSTESKLRTVNAKMDAFEEQDSDRKAIKFNWLKIIAAASVALVIGALIFMYSSHQRFPVQTAQNIDIGPGSNKAVLTLANGRKIYLDDEGSGLLATEAGANITKTNDGQLTYESNKTGMVTSSDLLNKINIPAGGQYQLVLPDGSKVWLNAKSSLQYPTSFEGKQQRNVELEGEAYFEITHNRRQPFIVKAGDQEIEVLGTHFNVNAYTDEPYKRTTLLEGSVQVSTGKKTILLRPGEQSQLSATGITVGGVNAEKAVAWKDGKMAFRKTDIRQVLREISRWYDIEIEYEGALPDYTISGEVPRTANLSGILKILSLSDVHYKQHGRKLTIYP